MRLFIKNPKDPALPYVPTERQQEFHTHPAAFKWYVGGFRSGKTVAGAAEALQLSLESPGTRGFIGRLKAVPLATTTMRTFWSMVPGGQGGPLVTYHNKNEGFIVLANGSEIVYSHLEDEQNLRSHEFAWWWLDEGQEVPEKIVGELMGRMSHPVGRHVGYITSNPNGRDHLFKMFAGKKHGNLTDPGPDFGMIHAPTWDNPHLVAEYVERLRRTRDERWISRYLGGSFDVFEGQIFVEFDQKSHVIPLAAIERGWRPDPNWIHIRTLDWGIGETAATAFLIISIDPEGNWYVWREYYRTGQTLSQIADEVRNLCGSLYFHYSVIDKKCYARESDGKVPAETLNEMGLWFGRSNSHVLGGLDAVRRLLAFDPEHRNPFTGLFGSPKLFIHPACQNLLEEFPQYRYHEDGSGKPAPNQQDHALDALRYGIMTRAAPPETPTADPRDEKTRDLERLMERLGILGGPDLIDTIGAENFPSRMHLPLSA